MEYIDLVLDNGELVRVEVPDSFCDQCHDTLENAMKRKDYWSPNQFDGAKAEYLGVSLSRIAMSRVVGII